MNSFCFFFFFAAKRKLISASDDRPSAKAVGTVGVVLLSVTLGILLLFDIERAVRFIIELTKAKR